MRQKSYKTCFTTVSSAVSWQIIRQIPVSSLRDTHPFLQWLADMSRGASLRMKNLFEPRALRVSERCVFCLNLLRQLSKLAD